MKRMLPPEIAEATRLARAGRIAEATALIQRALRDVAPGATATPAGPEDVATGVRPRGIVDSIGALGAVLRGVGLPAAPPPAAPEPLPAGARLETASFSNEAGTRSYKLFVPSSYRDEPLPLVVMLHGCLQSVDDFAAGTRMNTIGEERALLVAYPAQPKSANGSKCWNWFQPVDQQRNRGEPSLIAGIVARISQGHAIDPRRIYVAGLSAGGAAAAIMGAAYPDVFAAVGVHSGLACGAANDIASAFAAMQQGSPGTRGGAGCKVPTIVFHGDKDDTVHPRNGGHVIDQVLATGFAALRSATQTGRVTGGHGYTRTSHLDEHGRSMLEMWVVHGGGHAWSGGSAAGTFTDPSGPDASREMARFFLQHTRPTA